MKHFSFLKTGLANLLLLAFLISTSAQNIPIPIDSRFKIGKLNNGLTYYICKNTKPEKRVELRLALNAGAVQEDDDQLGMAHFVEHMCFNGTANFPKNDLIHYLQSVGVGFGDGINGYTSFDETVYMLTIPTDSIHVYNNGFLVMKDWASAVTFDTAEIRKERGVILEEWRLRLGAGQRMMNKFIPVLLKGSKYANRLPIGTQESILNTPAEKIIQYYSDWYRPDLMAFIVVGDIDPDSVEQKIIAEFSDIKMPENVRPKEIYPIDDNDEPLICVVTDKENTNTMIRLAFKTSIAPDSTYNDYKNAIIRNMFCNMLNQRFNELTKQANPPFLRAGAYYSKLWVRSREAFQISITVKEDGAEKGLKAALTEVERVKRYGFTQPEFDRLKKIFLKGAETAYNERDKQESGNIVWDCLSHFLNKNSSPGIAFYYNFLKNNIDSISLENINQLANEWITDKNQIVIATGIDKEGVKLPSEENFKTLLNWAKTAAVEPYKENIIAKDLITKKPKAGKIVSKKEIANLGITELTFANGLRVVLKPTDFKNDEIIMRSYSEGGTSLFGPEYKLSAQFATSFISESGINEFSRIDLNKMLAGKNASAGPYISDLYSGINGGCSVSDIETMLQLAYLYFTAPRTDDSAYHSVVSRIAAQYKNAMSNPQNYFYNQVQLKRYNNNPNAPGVFPNENDWNQLSFSKAIEVYKKCFSNASNFTFLFVGSFKIEEIQPLLELYLGSLPTLNKKETFADNGLRPIKGPLSEVIKKGEDPKALVYLTLSDTVSIWSKRESHLMYSFCQILTPIFIDKLREEMSSVYGFGLWGDVVSLPYKNFHFTMNIPCAPENSDKLVNEVLAEIERIKTKGFTAEEIKKEVERQRRETEVNLKENNWWMFSLDRIYRFEIDFNRIEKPNELTELLTPELLQETANKYFDTSKMVRFTLNPENSENVNALK